MAQLISSLPKIRGQYREQADMASSTWFRVGGPAEIVFKPSDAEDLQGFLKGCPADIPFMVMGLASNLLVRDGGIPGVVIKLGRAFNGCEIIQEMLPPRGGAGESKHAKRAPDEPWGGRLIRVGAATPGRNVALWCLEQGITGPEFLSGIPGCVGGAVAMNAGAYGQETADILQSVDTITRQGEAQTLNPKQLQMSYRTCHLPEGAVVTHATFACQKGERQAIRQRIDDIAQAREESQPLRTRTGGSTFKNPPGMKAWQLVDEAGCRGLTIGGAQMSEKHCNFMINTGNATAADIENLGEEIRRRVKETSGVELQWEIRRVGIPL